MCDENTSVFSVSKSAFEKLLKKDRTVSMSLLRALASRIRNGSSIGSKFSFKRTKMALYPTPSSGRL